MEIYEDIYIFSETFTVLPTLATVGISGSFEVKENTENKNHEDKRIIWMNGGIYVFMMEMNERKDVKSKERKKVYWNYQWKFHEYFSDQSYYSVNTKN